ncbi:hypothetical protein FRX31_016329 [Thalictrum thalictroides]|uniref:CCHC-type domain-containing protein n=1 Tax=Thalictrum thalictroides TaxID=46969 RepID=A0A7J6W9H7_THATH|nr:hypothetical protein FRX31_016329 [Thalictrum thalictroides]
MIEQTNQRLNVLEVAPLVPHVVNLNPTPPVNHPIPNGQEVPVDFQVAQDNKAWRRMVEGFMKMKPPKFGGSSDITVVEDWKEDIKNLFNAMGYTEAQKQILASLCLVGDVSIWWKAMIRTENLHDITWEDFSRRFDLKYFPHTLKAAKNIILRMIMQSMGVLIMEEGAIFTANTSQPPYKKQNTSPSSNGSTDGTKRNTRFMGTCFSCGKVGHKASDCKSSERNWGSLTKENQNLNHMSRNRRGRNPLELKDNGKGQLIVWQKND